MLQTSLARALLATKGYTEEAEQAYARALELCEGAGEVPAVIPSPARTRLFLCLPHGI